MSCSPLWPSTSICGGRGICHDEICICDTDYTGKGDFLSTNQSCMTNVTAIRVLWSLECMMACYALYVLIRQWRTTRASLANNSLKQTTSTPPLITLRITHRSCDLLRTLYHDLRTHPHLISNLSSICLQISFLIIVICKWINPMNNNISYDPIPTIFFMLGLQSYNIACTVHLYCFFKVLLTFTRFQNSSNNTRHTITFLQRTWIVIACINFITANMIPIVMLGMKDESWHHIGTILFFALKTITYLSAATVMSIFGRSAIQQLDAMPELHLPPIIPKHLRTSSHIPLMTVQITPIQSSQDAPTMTASSSIEEIAQYRQHPSSSSSSSQHDKPHESPSYTPAPSPPIMEEKSMGHLFVTSIAPSLPPLRLPNTHVTPTHQRSPSNQPMTARSYHSTKQTHIDGLKRHVRVVSMSGFFFACINLIFAIWPLAHLYVSYFIPIMCMLLSMHCASVATAAKKH